MAGIFGIVNLTRDSFSDGGAALDSDAALRRAQQLRVDGADVIDLGAESTHPDAATVPAEEEIARLAPVIEPLAAGGVVVSVDTCKPPVMRDALRRGAQIINDIAGFGTLEAVEAVAGSKARLVVMHAAGLVVETDAQGRLRGAKAGRVAIGPEQIVELAERFFEQRIAELERAGIERGRLILDPGMGFFLSSDPRASLAMLRHLPRLTRFGCPLLVSTSRKSFIGAVLGKSDARRGRTGGEVRAVGGRAAGTLATEVWAVLRGAAYIRTHEVAALCDALTILDALRGEEGDAAAGFRLA